MPSGSARGKVRVKTKAMAIRGDISGVTAPAHTRIWFAMYAGSESFAKKIPLMPVALLVVKITETVPRVI